MRKPLPYKVGNRLDELLKQEKTKRMIRGGEKFLLSELEEEVGSYCGVRRQAIYSLKRGKSNAGLPLAFKIAEYFNLKIEDIFYLYEEEDSQVHLVFEDEEEEQEEQEEEDKVSM